MQWRPRTSAQSRPHFLTRPLAFQPELHNAEVARLWPPLSRTPGSCADTWTRWLPTPRPWGDHQCVILARVPTALSSRLPFLLLCRPLEFFGQAARSRQGLAVAAALVASSGLIALAVVHTATRRTALAAVYPPFASSFGARPRATMQVHTHVHTHVFAQGRGDAPRRERAAKRGARARVAGSSAVA